MSDVEHDEEYPDEEHDTRIETLRRICQNLDEKEPDIDKNFYMVNLHGSENYKEFVVPKGVRLIMFCHAKTLCVNENFDQFVWENVALNEDACYNYCTFLSNLADYSSLRDHFCVYNEGDTITDLTLYKVRNDTFRPGVFQLPMKIGVFVGEDDEYEEDYNKVFYYPESIRTRVERDYPQQIMELDRSKTAYYSKYKDTEPIVYSYHYMPDMDTTLSALIKRLQVRIIGNEGFTLLLMTCRTSNRPVRPTFAPRVYDELEKMYENYLKRMDVE